MDGHDISTRPAWPYPGDTEVHRRERSWTLIAGSRRLSFTRVDYDTDSRPRRVFVPDARDGLRRQWSLTGLVALVLGSVAGLATLGLALHATRAASVDRYLLSVAVPPRVASTGTAAHRQRVAATVAPSAAIVVKPTIAVTPFTAEVGSLASSDATPIGMTAMDPAIGAALRTGTLQQWASADGGEHGFVVAGPADQGCRTLSILTRHDGGSAVQTRRECVRDVSDDVAVPPGNRTP